VDYASSEWAINCFVQTARRQVFKHGIRVGSVSPGPVISALLADWPLEKLEEARESGSLLEASEVADVIIFMLTRPGGMTIRDMVMPTNFDLGDARLSVPIRIPFFGGLIMHWRDSGCIVNFAQSKQRQRFLECIRATHIRQPAKPDARSE
jgi:hypothetical protein